MEHPTCSAEGCDSTSATIRRGLCPKHYERVRRHGSLEAQRPWRTDNQERAERRGRWSARRQVAELSCELEPHGFCSPRVIVHHVNEDPTDNRPENLRVLCNRHHILHHKGDFDLDNPDHSGYYVTATGTLRRRVRQFRHGVHPEELE